MTTSKQLFINYPPGLSDEDCQKLFERARYETFSERSSGISNGLILLIALVIVAVANAEVLSRTEELGLLVRALLSGLIVGAGGAVAGLLYQYRRAKVINRKISELSRSFGGD